MAAYYLDSSGLVKLYVTEAGSEWITALVHAVGPAEQRAHTVASSNVAIVEVAAAFGRLQRMKVIDAGQRIDLHARFSADQEAGFQWVRLDGNIVNEAADLTQRHPLRGYDAVHLASALAFNRALVNARLAPATFVSADGVLCDAAKTEGLQVENPNDKP